MLVSFIIPSYNSADTISRCLDSIYALSLKQDEFEVIFVDDCSSDNTIEIVEAYQSQYSNITLLRQPRNNRQGAARNRGVKHAKGEYICFVDSDDEVTSGMQTAIRMAKAQQLDMVAVHFCSMDEQGRMLSDGVMTSSSHGHVFEGVDMRHDYPVWCAAPVPYVYSNLFLKQVNYPFAEGVLYEDADYVVVHHYYAKRMAYSSELGYIFHYREGSTTRSLSHKNVADYLLLGTRMLAFYRVIQTYKQVDFAKRVLEGACYNVTRATNHLLFKLGSMSEISFFYDRVDKHINRKELYDDELMHTYFWNQWTTLVFKHRHIATAIAFSICLLYRAFAVIRNLIRKA